MEYTKATIFVPPALVAQIRQMAAQELLEQGQAIDAMWSYPCSSTGEAPAEMWMHTGFFGNQFFAYFVDPETLAANTGMSLEQASGMQTAVQVVAGAVDGEPQQALDATGLKRISLLDVNTATQSQLIAVPLVGETIAAAIISDRPWVSVEELQEISGVGPVAVEELKRWLCVEQ